MRPSSRDYVASASITPLPRAPSLSQAIAGKLQERIAQKQLRAGERLPGERDLAAALAVGRPALREAIRYLEGLGIVSVVHGKGVFVVERQTPPLTDLSKLDSGHRLVLLRQATGVRRLLDVQATREAVKSGTREDLRRMQAYFVASETEPLLTKRKFAIDLAFEQLIGEAAHNPYLLAAQRVAHQMFKAAWESCGYIPRPAEMRTAHHREIYEAIRARDEPSAVRLMNEHIAISVLPPEASKARATAKKRRR